MNDLTAAGAMVTAHLHGGPGADTSGILDSCNPRAAADILACALAGALRTAGGDPDELIPALIAERMRRVTLSV